MTVDIRDILIAMGLTSDPAELQIAQYKHEEDEGDYQVWKVTDGSASYVLKRAKGDEAEVYTTFLMQLPSVSPKLYRVLEYQEECYLLMEQVDGHDLCRCDRASLTKTLDALIALQRYYWEDREHDEVAYSFSRSLVRRQDRRNYLKDAELETAYEAYLQRYASVPRTLCHDDLLPFNVLISDSRAVIIDWELAGILPYPTSLARLLAHATEEEDAFFYMSDDDKAFAIRYYYEHLVAEKGIDYEEYRATLEDFLLYEYCEWIMLGNKYEDADMNRYRQYLHRAKELIRKQENKR